VEFVLRGEFLVCKKLGNSCEAVLRIGRRKFKAAVPNNVRLTTRKELNRNFPEAGFSGASRTTSTVCRLYILLVGERSRLQRIYSGLSACSRPGTTMRAEIAA
jgi:hypothetical protein